MSRGPMQRWRERGGRVVELAIPFADIMEIGLALLTLSPDELDALNQLADLELPDGSEISNSQINALIAAMAAYETANPGFNPATARAVPVDATLDAALDTDWSRTISGTSSPGVLAPGYGNNTITATGGEVFEIGPNDGNNTINDFVGGTGANADRIDLSGFGADASVQITVGTTSTIISYGPNLASTITLRGIPPAKGEVLGVPSDGGRPPRRTLIATTRSECVGRS